MKVDTLAAMGLVHVHDVTSIMLAIIDFAGGLFAGTTQSDETRKRAEYG